MKPTAASDAGYDGGKLKKSFEPSCHRAALAPPVLHLDEALHRFEQEAVHSVCPTGGYRCPYFIWGSGPPLVFIHGLGDLACCYVPIISVLARDFRCIGYEQPTGCGDGGFAVTGMRTSSKIFLRCLITWG